LRRALMWVSGMSEASAANPDEGAERCEATEERQLGVRRSTNRLHILARRTPGGRGVDMEKL